jgi:hypothetical protein
VDPFADYLATLAARIVSAVIVEVLKELPAIMAGIHLANVTTMRDAPSAPQALTDALNQSIADAIRRGTVPGPGVP